MVNTRSFGRRRVTHVVISGDQMFSEKTRTASSRVRLTNVRRSKVIRPSSSRFAYHPTRAVYTLYFILVPCTPVTAGAVHTLEFFDVRPPSLSHRFWLPGGHFRTVARCRCQSNRRRVFWLTCFICSFVGTRRTRILTAMRVRM